MPVLLRVCQGYGVCGLEFYGERAPCQFLLQFRGISRHKEEKPLWRSEGRVTAEPAHAGRSRRGEEPGEERTVDPMRDVVEKHQGMAFQEGTGKSFFEFPFIFYLAAQIEHATPHVPDGLCKCRLA